MTGKAIDTLQWRMDLEKLISRPPAKSKFEYVPEKTKFDEYLIKEFKIEEKEYNDNILGFDASESNPVLKIHDEELLHEKLMELGLKFCPRCCLHESLDKKRGGLCNDCINDEKYEIDPLKQLRNSLQARAKNAIKSSSNYCPLLPIFDPDYKTTNITIWDIRNRLQSHLNIKNKRVHLDHIIPVFFARNESELYLLYHYTNLRLISSKINVCKYKTLPDRDELPDDLYPKLFKIYDRES